jgi:pimeloyl-ACP methyl ester carboxylesterase
VFRTRFKKQIVAEFLPPSRRTKTDRVIILCDGMPGIPRKKPLVQFLASKGYWVIYPRYRGAWESDGEFLKRSPHEDILDIIDELPSGLTEAAFGQKFALKPADIFVIGGSFGGAVALLASLDKRVSRVIANCPVVDWSVLKKEEKTETSNPDYAAYLHDAFGNAYRMKARNWRKLYTGKFFNPMHQAAEMDPAKILMFHAKDDPHIPWRSVEKFSQITGAQLKLLYRGGHLKTEFIVRKYWTSIEKFLLS